MDFEEERKKADALLHVLGTGAIQRASDQADFASLHGNHERAAYWRRVTALIAAKSPVSLKSEPAQTLPIPSPRIADRHC